MNINFAHTILLFHVFFGEIQFIKNKMISLHLIPQNCQTNPKNIQKNKLKHFVCCVLCIE